MKLLKYLILVTALCLFMNNNSFAEKKDCSQIKNDTLVGNVKYLMCKTGGKTTKETKEKSSKPDGWFKKLLKKKNNTPTP